MLKYRGGVGGQSQFCTRPPRRHSGPPDVLDDVPRAPTRVHTLTQPYSRTCYYIVIYRVVSWLPDRRALVTVLSDPVARTRPRVLDALCGEALDHHEPGDAASSDITGRFGPQERRILQCVVIGVALRWWAAFFTTSLDTRACPFHSVYQFVVFGRLTPTFTDLQPRGIIARACPSINSDSARLTGYIHTRFRHLFRSLFTRAAGNGSRGLLRRENDRRLCSRDKPRTGMC